MGNTNPWSQSWAQFFWKLQVTVDQSLLQSKPGGPKLFHALSVPGTSLECPLCSVTLVHSSSLGFPCLSFISKAIPLRCTRLRRVLVFRSERRECRGRIKHEDLLPLAASQRLWLKRKASTPHSFLWYRRAPTAAAMTGVAWGVGLKKIEQRRSEEEFAFPPKLS